MDSVDWDAELMLKRYIYDYMVRKNLNVSAELFKEEADVVMNTVAINDSPWGFLFEWWLIFWDMYTARHSITKDQQDTQQDASETSPFPPNNQEGNNSNVMEVGSSSNQPWPENQQLQPNMMMMMPPMASSLDPGDQNVNLLHNFLMNRINQANQQIKPQYYSVNPFCGLNEDWLKKSTVVQEDAQAMNIRSVTSAMPAVLQIEDEQQGNAVAQQSQQGGNGSTSLNMEYQGLMQMPPQFIQFQQQFPFQGFQPPILENQMHLTAKGPEQSSSLVQIDKQKAKKTFNNEAARKRKGPSPSDSGKNPGNKEVTSQPKLVYSGLASPCKEESLSQTLMKRSLQAAAPEISKAKGGTSNAKEGEENKIDERLQDATGEGPTRDREQKESSKGN